MKSPMKFAALVAATGSLALAGGATTPQDADAHRVRSGGGWVIPAYVVRCESGFRNVVNTSPAGRRNGYPAGYYQITGPTWRAYGGRRYAPTANRATKRQQGIIARRVLRGQGPRAWACWRT